MWWVQGFWDAAYQEAHLRVFLTNPLVQGNLTRLDSPSSAMLIKHSERLSSDALYLTWERECINRAFGSASISVCLPDLMFFIKVRVNWSMKGLHSNQCSHHLQNCLGVFDIMLRSVTTLLLEIPSVLLLPAIVFEVGGGYSIPATKKP